MDLSKPQKFDTYRGQTLFLFILLSLSLSVTTGRCIKEARTRTGEKCCEQQLRRVDKALSRAGDIPEESWICLSRRNLILTEGKRCSCSFSWGQGKILALPRCKNL